MFSRRYPPFTLALLRQAFGCDKYTTWLVVFISTLVLSSFVCMSVVVGQDIRGGSPIDWTTHENIVHSLQEQILLLKWMGGLIVTSLVGAIGLLYRALEKANAVSRSDLIQGIGRREELLEDALKVMSDQTAAVQRLSEAMESRKT